MAVPVESLELTITPFLALNQVLINDVTVLVGRDTWQPLNLREITCAGNYSADIYDFKRTDIYIVSHRQ